MSSKHQDFLRAHCRVCGKRFGKAYKFDCNKHKELLVHYGVDPTQEDNLVFPESFCNSCYLTAKKTRASGDKLSTRKPIDWLPHVEDSTCFVCDVLCKGGGSKRKVSTGRPTLLQQHLKSVHSKIPHFTLSQVGTDDKQKVTCDQCSMAANKPVEIVPCRAIVCYSCCISLATQMTFNCPSCSTSHDSAVHTFTRPSYRVEKTFNELLVNCEKCQCRVKLESIEEECAYHDQRQSLPTLQDIVNQQQYKDKEPTNLEKQAAMKVVSRLLHQSDSGTLTVSTGGRPISLVKVTNSSVHSGESSQDTVRRRSQELLKIRKRLSIDDDEHQMADELKMLPGEVREELMKDMKFTVYIPPDQSLAMKADLCLPWKKLRIMRRWMKAWNITVASERKQRDCMKENLSDVEIRGEAVPFSFSTRHGAQEIRPAPLACVVDLASVIFYLLDEKDRLKQLTWHDGLIPENEIWLKVGGDKGGSSFKASFQIVNVEKPNSIRNSCVFALFEAPDSAFNLHLALDQYKQSISELQETQWRGHSIRIFLSGDYEFLCNIYGISGASGRHCCLWCSITSEQLKVPRATRRDVTLRSLDTLAHCHSEYLADGANLKKAKFHQNVIDESFFNVPLSQVCPPGLHITLGIFQRLFNLLEEECHLLDQSVTEPCGSTNTFGQYIQAKSAVASLEEKRSSLTTELNQAQQVLLLLLMTVPNPEQDRRVQEVSTLISTNTKGIAAIDKSIDEYQVVLRKGFQREDGVFVKSLDKALGSFNVERQAYHGGSFIGNHIHRALKPQNVQTLCKAVTTTAATLFPSSTHLHQEATDISQKFLDAFSLFAACHQLYDSSSLMSDEEILQLETAIDTFLRYYRETFPSATVLPKMHMLEDHIIPWVRQWRVGCGLMGEQGAESLHAAFNTTERAYCNMRDRVERLKLVLQNHHFRTLPSNQSLEPPPLKIRKKSTTD